MEHSIPHRAPGSPFLSACLIVRDEQDFLDRCLGSLAGFVDEICVLDTGSKDHTLEIARKHGARIGFREWDDDFSAARNACLDLARGEWIFQIDADEELVSPEGAWSTLLESRNVCLLVELDLRSSHGASERTWQPRLFRRHPRLRYSRALHETILDNLADAGLPPPVRSPLLLIHHGYLDEVVASRGKFERNLRILRTCRDRGNADAYDFFKLAAALEGAGNDVDPTETSRTWASCMNLGSATDISTRMEWPWWPRACRGAAQDLWCQGRLDESRSLLLSAIADFPEDEDLPLQLADLELALGLAESSLGRLRAGSGSIRLSGLRLAFTGDWNRALSTWNAEGSHLALVARAHFRLGHADRAIEVLSKAIPVVGDSAESALDVAETLIAMGESETAAAFLRRPLRGSRIALARCASLSARTAGEPPAGPPLDIDAAAESILDNAIRGEATFALDKGFSRPVIRDRLADRLEAYLASGNEDPVREFAKSAPRWEGMVPGISRLVGED